MARPGRTLLGACAVALGVALVVAVTSCYESLRVSLNEWVQSWLSRGELEVRQRERDEAGLPAALADRIRAVPGVATLAPRWQHYIDLVADGRDTGTSMIGIVPEAEYQVSGFRPARGRLLRAGDTDGLMLAEEVAQALGLAPGDTVFARDSNRAPHPLRLVGTILQPRFGLWRRAHAYCLMDTLRRLKPEYAEPRFHTLDITLERWAAAGKVQDAIEHLLPLTAEVVTTPSQVRPIEAGMRLLSVILVWTSVGALLTAWFIILATLDLGVVERTRELGTLRCVGAGRAQIAASVFVESLPPAAVGVATGLPMGLGLARLAATWFEGVFGRFVVSVPGLWFAGLGGLVATACAAAVPAVNAARLSAVAAMRPEARAPRAWVRLAAAAAGAALFALLAWAVWGRRTISPGQLAAVVILAWPAGLAATMGLVPLVISGLGRLLRWPVGFLLRLPRQLTAVHLGRAPWRSALVACALAIGVSLVVNLLTNTESIIAGWALPRKFPGLALGLPQAFAADPGRLTRLAQIEGVGRLAPVTATEVAIAGKPPGAPVQFLGIAPRLADEMIQLNFVQGDARDAFRALAEGGAVIVPRAFVRAYDVGLGDAVIAVSEAGRSGTFRVAGVVESAGIDLVQNYYEEAGGFLQALSSKVMIGSEADARRVFGASAYRLILLDFDLPAALTDVERRREEDRIIEEARQTLVPFFGHLVPAIRMSELKTLIDRDFRRAVLWMAFAAGVACVVAGLGVVNLMMANVTARARPIAVLRGVGATRWMISRLVLAEGLVLGVIGSGLGLLHGLFMAAMSNQLDRVAFAIEPRFAVPWPTVAVGLGTAVAVAVLASILPGIHAGRTNIAAALDSA